MVKYIHNELYFMEEREMPVYLRNISIKGIKNLCNEVELIFSKKEIKVFSELRNYNIKTIYGPNGSGKTALVHAFQVLRDIIRENGYLYDPDNAKYLYELMNKVCKTIQIKADFFYANGNERPEIYTYEINIAYKNASFEIIYEKYSKKISEYAKEKIIIESKDGVFINYDLQPSLKNEFTNLLKKRSFAEIFLELYKKGFKETGKIKNHLEGSFDSIEPLFVLVYGTRIILDAKDNHLPAVTYNTEKLMKILKYRQENQELIKVTEETGYNAKLLSEDELNDYKEEAKKKAIFIKLFKPNIKDIKVESKLVKSSKEEDVYSVNDFIDYGDYSIDIELESVGIKKLMNLYSSLKHLSMGGILVIDDLDSHINDIYLVKLIEYISEYSNGQLIFTTHNVSPMETLKSKKNSIDFMSMSGKLTSWTQIGNYSPANLYKKGMVQGLPFNLEAEAFLGVFSNE
ncbi:MAG: AAA family ATPase [Tenericutes bacterium]|nr:AAA family ATPase [Mycoplasmatota bacterium]